MYDGVPIDTVKLNEKINNNKDPIYLPHICRAWSRYAQLANLTGKTKNSSKISIKQRCKTMLHALTIKPKFSKHKPKIDQSETSEAEDDEKDNDYEDSDDDDSEYGYPDCPSSSLSSFVEQYETIDYIQYSLVTFPKLLDCEDETRMYITKQSLFINNGWMSAKRTDIMDLLARMFENNGYEDQQFLPENFIEKLRMEYGDKKRKQYFDDVKYDKREFDFNDFQYNRN